jgi:hypothetical protein
MTGLWPVDSKSASIFMLPELPHPSICSGLLS